MVGRSRLDVQELQLTGQQHTESVINQSIYPLYLRTLVSYTTT